MNGIKDVVESSNSSRSTSPVPPPHSNAPNPNEATAATSKPAAAAATVSTTGTSTLKAGVGYETGKFRDEGQMIIYKNMSAAAKKQSKIDDMCQPLIERLVSFIKEYDGSEGMVLLALKMSPTFNRLLFSLLKNDSLLEWGERKKIYDVTLDMLDMFSESQFYVAFLLHNLLEGNGLKDDGKATCQALLETLNVKATIMTRSQKKLAKSSSGDDDAVTLAMCRKIMSTNEKVNAAIKSGRELGIVVNPENETTSKDISSSGPTHLMNALLAEAEARPPPTLQEEKDAYVKEMVKYRLQHVEIIKAASQTTTYKYLSEATRAASSSGSSVTKKRMLRISSEIAGLSADLPVEWYSGIFGEL